MSGPTQVLPSWYTISTTTLTDAAGVPTATSESLLYLPLTYYGPSIPLGSLWTYGGLTSPASTSSASPTETSTSATPTTTSSLTSSLTSSVPSSSSSPLSSTFSSSSVLPSSSASSIPSAANGLSRNQLIGIIVGSVIGFIFLFVFILLMYICCQHRRRRDPRFSMVNAPRTPIDEDYYIVGPGGQSPEEGSPRSSGEVEDSFLRRGEERKTAGVQQMSNVAPAAATAAATGAEPPSQNSSLGSSSRSSNSAASGYGNVLPSAFGAAGAAPQPAQRWGNILSREELRRLDEEDEDQDDTLVHSERNLGTGPKYDEDHDPEVYPLMPPPRLVDPDRSRSRLSHQPSLGSQMSGDPTEATVHTARRVKAEDLAPRSPPQDVASLPTDTPGAGPSGRRDSGVWKGLGTLAAGLGRLGWFSSSNSSSRRNSTTAWSSAPLSDNDVEQGRALLNDPSPPPQMTEFRRPGTGLGLTPTGDRPISSVSAKSGSSVYYSAPGTPHPSTPLPTPPPRVLGNSASAEMGYWPRPPQTPPIPTGNTSSTRTTAYETAISGSTGEMSQRHHVYQHPGHYDALTLSSTAEGTGPSYGPGDSGIDILDMPIPRGISPFASTTSLRESQDVTTPESSLNSQKKAGLAFPPGLDLPTPGVWNETQGTTPSPGSFAAGSRNVSVPDFVANRTSAGGDTITIDVLEEAPPRAAERWKSIASSAGGSSGFSSSGDRRTTFGLPQFVHQPYSDLTSEIGSLHSMRSSHLSPHSSPAGSAAASRREQSGSAGSSLSRPSAARSARSILSSSEGHSLSHSGSISSDGRKKHRAGTGTMSPALSAFGHDMRIASGSTTGSGPMRVGHGQYPTSTISEVSGEGDARVQLGSRVMIDGPGYHSAPSSPRIGRSLSPRPRDNVDRALSLSPIPWAGGLEDSWTPS